MTERSRRPALPGWLRREKLPEDVRTTKVEEPPSVLGGGQEALVGKLLDDRHFRRRRTAGDREGGASGNPAVIDVGFDSERLRALFRRP